MQSFIKAPSFRRGLAAAMALVLLCGTLLLFGAADKPVVSPASKPVGLGGYGVYVDDVFVAALASADDAMASVEGICGTVADIYSAPEGEHAIVNDVRFISGIYEETAFTDGAGLTALLGDGGDKFDFTVKDVYGADTGIQLQVSTTVYETVVEGIPYTTEYEGTNLLPLGNQVVVIEGVEGKAENSYDRTYINGTCTQSYLADSKLLSAPSSATVWQGTTSGATLMDEGEKLMLPHTGYISSWYGYRTLWGRVEFHKGLDFARYGGCYGDPIYAAADGVVTFADHNGGYGKEVIVGHGAGMTTIYAHCSELLVKPGDVVKKGDVIAYVGNTGRVTGPHLHFQIEINGLPVNPKDYLDWSSYNDPTLS